MIHSMAELSSSTMRIKINDAIISAVETALTGKMIASGTNNKAKIRSSRNEGSCFNAAKNPSME